MSSMGELTFFLGLQVKQKEVGIFIIQDKYVVEILKKFDFLSVKTACIPIETQKHLVKDEEVTDVDVHLYRFQVTPKTSHLQAMKRIFSLRMAGAATKPYQGDSSEFYLITGNDADGVECLPNEEIFTELARMGYEKPPPKLTFYKAFFSTQWKFLIHTLVQCCNAPLYKEDARRVGKGFFRVDTPLFATMLVQPQPPAEEEEDDVEVPVAPTPPSPTNAPSPPPQEPITTPPQAQPAPPSSPP
nr:hypothetical protein [Tanacetum cinerariifolium]